MIESSFLSSSHWDADIFEDLEFIHSSLDFEELSCEFENESFKLSDSHTSSPVDICSSSSDYDGLLLDEIEKILPVSDLFVSQILEDEPENVGGFSEMDWLLSKSPKESSNTSLSNSDGRAFVSDPFQWILAAKPWSKMIAQDQLKTLHALSEIVTFHMGISEQLEIIHVLNPNAVISPDDKEFALDSTNLSDAKLKKIKDLIRTHKNTSNSSHRSTKKSSSTHIDKIMPRKKTNMNYFRTKRKQKQKKEKVIEVHVLEHKKRELQNIKELRSGFFRHELKMKINPNENEEDEDVNILE